MLVNTKKIKALNPCPHRLNHYLQYYDNFKGTMSKFLDLPHLTHADKLWVFFRLIDKSLISKIAADLAERVLEVYESQYPGDCRPRTAVEAARAGNSDAATTSAAYAAYTAAYAAYAAAYALSLVPAAASAYAAYAATSAATYAALPTDAASVIAATYAVDTAYAASNAAGIPDLKYKEETAQILIMKKWAKLNPKTK